MTEETRGKEEKHEPLLQTESLILQDIIHLHRHDTRCFSRGSLSNNWPLQGKLIQENSESRTHTEEGKVALGLFKASPKLWAH